MESALQELHDQFLRILDEGGPEPEIWHKVWVLFIEHPWFQAELRRAIRRVLWREDEYQRWAGDVEQQAVVILARKLSRKASLNVNRAKAERQFSGWLASIIDRICRDALRSMRRRQRHAGILKSWIEVAEPGDTSIDDLLDLARMIEKLPSKCQTVISLRLRGQSFVEIGARLGVSRSQAHRGFRGAILLLRDISERLNK